ncbi:FAD-binding protein [Fulvivirgaceae bacterium BMA12]|uniref:FAD-binding protein n=1 Tax=Agaribacillus aureus TaxID=3051825 RepID=A0ABT8LEI2_9BACT|nr:FAD-binding protein [Fulvivirgaceae bacterium BMA12]
MEFKTRHTWKNTIKKFSVTPVKYFLPESLEDIVQIIKEAEDKGLRARAIGSGHSFSDIALSDGYLVDMCRLNEVCTLNKEVLKGGCHLDNLIEIQSGISIHKLNRDLDDRNLAILNMGGVDNQTISGAIATGTHGTGIDLPGISGMVKSMVMVVRGGKTLRIEPTDGITDPTQYNHETIELVQDDDKFYSALVSLGCLGIIYSYILEVEDMYWLEEQRTCHLWEEIKPQIADKTLFKGTRGVQVQINPYKLPKKQDRTCMVMKHILVEKPKKRTIGQATRNLLSGYLANIPIAYYFTLFNVVFRPRSIPKLLETALNGQHDKSFINRAHKVLYQGVEFIKLRAYDCEFAFDLAENKHLDAVESLFKLVAQMKDEGRLYQSAPLGLRFVKRSNAYMTMEYGRDVMYMDTPFMTRTKGSDLILDHFQDLLLSFGGIPHWGKINNRLIGRPELVRQMYPKFKAWQKVFLEFNAKGTFSNQFSDRLLFDQVELPSSIKRPEITT